MNNQSHVDRRDAMFDKFQELADFYKMFGDESRLKILFELDKGEKCVNDIAEKLDMTHSAVSHQLKNLKMARLVKSRKDGKFVYYSFDDEHVKVIFEMAIEHLMH